MKKFFLISLIIIAGIHFKTNAQQKFSIGYFQSYPLGVYGSTDIADGSFAQPGWGVVLESRAKMPNLPDGLFLGFHYSYQYNDFDSQAFATAIDNSLGDPFRSLVSNSSYHPSVITLGPYYEFNPINRFSVELRSGLGIMFTNIDPIVINVYDGFNSLVYSEVFRFQSKPTFTYLAGMTVGFDITRYLRLGAFVEHSSAKEEIKSTFDNIDFVSSEFKLIYLNAGINFSVGF